VPKAPTIRQLLVEPSTVADDPSVVWAAVATACDAGDEWTAPSELSDASARDRVRREAVRLIDSPAEALVASLDAVLLSSSPARGLNLLQQMGVIAVLLPEVDALVGFHDTADSHHKDLWEHTRLVIGQMPPDPDLRWAALLHDIGKTASRVVNRPGKVTFWHHEALGAWLSRGVMARLKMPLARAERIGFVVEHHGRVNAYEPSWTDRAVRRMRRDLEPRLGDLIAFSKADFTTRRSHRRARIQRQLQHLEERLERLAREDAAPRLPSGFGTKAAEATGLAGAELGQALAWLQLELASGRVEGVDEALLAHLDAR